MKLLNTSMCALLVVGLTAAPAFAAYSEKIAKVQKALKDKGIDPGPLDGLIGPLTRAAVKQFQEQESLTASGEPDGPTCKKLGVGGGGGAAKAPAADSGGGDTGGGEPAAAAGGANAAVPFPKGFREWHHVKSMIIYGKEHPLIDPFGGIHHVYVNDAGYAALKAKKGDFPNGSVLVFDLMEADQSGGAVTEGKRKFTAAMVRDTKKYKDTEGWGWQVFVGGDATKPAVMEAAAARACATCHKEVSTKAFVFAEYRP